MFSERDPVSPDQGQIKGAVALNGNSSIFYRAVYRFLDRVPVPACCQPGHYSRRVLTAFYSGGVGHRPLSKGVFVVKWLQMEGVEGVFESDGALVLFRKRTCFIPMDLLLFRKFLKFC